MKNARDIAREIVESWLRFGEDHELVEVSGPDLVSPKLEARIESAIRRDRDERDAFRIGQITEFFRESREPATKYPMKFSIPDGKDDHRITFGKYRGQYLKAIDPLLMQNYIGWIRDQAAAKNEELNMEAQILIAAFEKIQKVKP